MNYVASAYSAGNISEHSLAHAKTIIAKSTVAPKNIKTILEQVFEEHHHNPIDLEALIYLVMQHFDVSPTTYVMINNSIRAHILDNKEFKIIQGALIHPMELSTRRINVGCSRTY